MKAPLANIPQLTGNPNYRTDSDLTFLREQIERYKEVYGLDMDPDFQRGHVWNADQKRKFLEFLLRGGKGQDILFNHPNWMGKFDKGNLTIVDGKQRLTACLEFLDGEFGVFPTKENPEGWNVNELDPVLLRRTHIGIGINSLKTRKELLTWYLELNEGHVAHQPEELEKVRRLIHAEEKPVTLKREEHANRNPAPPTM